MSEWPPPRLVMIRGLPGSGKTTLARAWVAAAPYRARVNRDDLRAMCHDSVWAGIDTEQAVVAVRNSAIGALLKRAIGVVVDETNLPYDTLFGIVHLGRLFAAEMLVVDLSNVDVEVCVARQFGRTGPAVVPESAIRQMWADHVEGHPYPLIVPEGVAVVPRAELVPVTAP